MAGYGIVYIMKYTVNYTHKALKQLKKLDKRLVNKITAVINGVAVSPHDPHPNLKPLRGDIGDYRMRIGDYRMRIGDYRVIYDLDDGLRILEVIKIGHRKEIYR